MLGAGALIWVSFRPLLRLFLCVASGFILTKAELFPVQAARGAGQIALNIAMPSLMFSRIVPAFSSDNISALGPLVLIAFIYQGIGMVMAWAITQIFWVPHRFRHGMIAAGIWGNVGDIPTSVIMSITAVAPFNGTADEDLAVAYISAFILVFFVTLFPMGGNRLIARDFVGPDVEPDEVRERLRRRQRKLLLNFVARARNWKHPFSSTASISSDEKASDPEFRPHSPSDFEADAPKARSYSKAPLSNDHGHDLNEKDVDDCGSPGNYGPSSPTPSDAFHNRMPSMSRHVSFCPQDDGGTTIVPPHSDAALASRFASPVASRFTSPAPTIVHGDQPIPPIIPTNPTLPSFTSESAVARPSNENRTRRQKILSNLRTILLGFVTPASLSIIIAFPIALITPVKSLFTTTSYTGIPNAPDGEPPLAFIMDTTTFMGGASVPLGLVCLGSALARLKVPSFRSSEEWQKIPRGAIMSLAIGKMIISPVLGVLIVRGLTKAGVVDSEDKVLQFVCIFLSCLPTATTQVFLTQVYSGTGSAEHLSPFLIPQYIIMFVSMTALTAYTLQLLF